MPENQTKKSLGNSGEQKAALYLIEEGFEIIEKNYRFHKSGEIDIIAKKENLLVFAEVKARKTQAFGGALYSISKNKQRTLRFIANQFLNENPEFYTKNITCRFDLISIENENIEWVQDIIR
jgi:putative endonuclease